VLAAGHARSTPCLLLTSHDGGRTAHRIPLGMMKSCTAQTGEWSDGVESSRNGLVKLKHEVIHGLNMAGMGGDMSDNAHG
jgi:hypothetical protein